MLWSKGGISITVVLEMDRHGGFVGMEIKERFRYERILFIIFFQLINATFSRYLVALLILSSAGYSSLNLGWLLTCEDLGCYVDVTGGPKRKARQRLSR